MPAGATIGAAASAPASCATEASGGAPASSARASQRPMLPSLVVH